MNNVNLRAELIANLLTNEGQRILVQPNGPMEAQVVMKLGTNWTQQHLLTGSERFTVGSAVPDDRRMLLTLFPVMKTEYSHIATKRVGDFNFAVVRKDGGETGWMEVEDAVELLLEEPSMEAGLNWGQFIDRAVALERKREVAKSRMANNEVFGSW